jgi:hypothetical protein
MLHGYRLTTPKKTVSRFQNGAHTVIRRFEDGQTMHAEEARCRLRLDGSTSREEVRPVRRGSLTPPTVGRPGGKVGRPCHNLVRAWALYTSERMLEFARDSASECHDRAPANRLAGGMPRLLSVFETGRSERRAADKDDQGSSLRRTPKSAISALPHVHYLTRKSVNKRELISGGAGYSLVSRSQSR